jgi:hypothetical protein
MILGSWPEVTTRYFVVALITNASNVNTDPGTGENPQWGYR